LFPPWGSIIIKLGGGAGGRNSEGKRGQEIYGKRGKGERGTGSQRWQEAGELGKITQHFTVVT